MVTAKMCARRVMVGLAILGFGLGSSLVGYRAASAAVYVGSALIGR